MTERPPAVGGGAPLSLRCGARRGCASRGCAAASPHNGGPPTRRGGGRRTTRRRRRRRREVVSGSAAAAAPAAAVPQTRVAPAPRGIALAEDARRGARPGRRRVPRPRRRWREPDPVPMRGGGSRPAPLGPCAVLPRGGVDREPLLRRRAGSSNLAAPECEGVKKKIQKQKKVTCREVNQLRRQFISLFFFT